MQPREDVLYDVLCGRLIPNKEHSQLDEMHVVPPEEATEASVASLLQLVSGLRRLSRPFVTCETARADCQNVVMRQRIEPRIDQILRVVRNHERRGILAPENGSNHRGRALS